MKKLNVGIVGVDTLVGKEIIKCLLERSFPVSLLKPLVTHRIGERMLVFENASYAVDLVSAPALRGLDVVFMADRSEDASLSKNLSRTGVTVIDGTGSFVEDAGTLVVVPEVNGDIVRRHHGVFLSPSPAVVFLALVLKPIQFRFGISRLQVHVFHCASEQGYKGLVELQTETENTGSVSGLRIIPGMGLCDAFTGLFSEEKRMACEIQKLMGPLTLSVVSIRVPTFHGTTVSVFMETKEPIEVNFDQLRFVLSRIPWLAFVEEQGSFKPQDAVNTTKVLVGNLRKSTDVENGLEFFVSGNNLKKGLALNMVQIAEQAMKERMVVA